MAVITTKYSINDVVFWASTQRETKQHPCPDCLGSRKWKAISPAGSEYDFQCPRCSARYTSNDKLSLQYAEFGPHVRTLTIGSVRIDTASHFGVVSQPEYMCHETGVGSGQIYKESDLFLSQDEAVTAATLMASKQNSSTPWVAEIYNRTLEISDYQLSNAEMELAKKEHQLARSLLYNVEDLMAQIEESSNLDAAKEAVEEYRNYSFDTDQKKLEDETVGAAS